MAQVNLLFVGDIAFFPKNVNQDILYNQNKLVLKTFQEDIKAANFEFPISNDKIPFFDNSYIEYCAPIESIKILKNFKFDLFTLANNHILDWGLEGIQTTKAALKKIGAECCGAGKDEAEARTPVIINKNGVTIGFLAYCTKGVASARDNLPGAAPLYIDKITCDIKSLIKTVDHVVIIIHWGTEFSEYPYPPDIKTAHAIIDAGASCIIGHHPHVVQGMEVYNGRPIFYSLGSFIYSPFSERVFVNKKINERLTSIAVRITMSNKELITWDIIPFKNTKDFLIPEPLEKTDKIEFYKKIDLLSKRINEGEHWYYNEVLENLLAREFKAIWYRTIKTKGFFLLRKISQIRIRHIKILLYPVYSYVRNFR